MKAMMVVSHVLTLAVGLMLGLALAMWLHSRERQPEVAQVEPAAARLALLLANCDNLSETERAVEREQVLLLARDSPRPQACTMDYCGDPQELPAVCPQGTPLAATGKPVEVPMEEIVEQEKQRQELKNEVAAEHERKEAAADAAQASGAVVPEPAPASD